MKIEQVDGSQVFSELWTDEEGRTWNFLIRSDGSVSLYYTVPDYFGHLVVWDSAWNERPSQMAQVALMKLAELRAGIGKLQSEVQFMKG